MSKEKLAIEHLAPYLPYKLNYKINGKFCSTTMSGLQLDVWFDDYNDESIKPILRPLSDLTKEIEHNGEKFVPLIKMGLPNKTSVYNDITYVIKKGHTPYIEMQKLLEWHFDVFSLIDQNLAINLNEVK